MKKTILVAAAVSAMSARHATVLAQSGGQIADVMKSPSMGKTEQAIPAVMEAVTGAEAAQLSARQQGKMDYITKSPIPTVDSDGLPNRLSIERSSPYYTNCGAYVGVRIDGEEAPNCIEFSVSGGWVRLASGNGPVSTHEAKTAPRKHGKVEAYWRATPSRQVRRQIARMAR